LRSSEAASTGGAAEAGAGLEVAEDVAVEVDGKLPMDAAAERWAPADKRHFSTKEAARCCGKPYLLEIRSGISRLKTGIE
jgi:hypothetical protein